MNFIKKNLLLVVAAVVIIIGGGWWVADQNKPAEKTTDTTQVNTEKKTSATVSVNDGTSTKTYTFDNAAGKTALEVTQTAISDVKMTGTGTNAYITAINGRAASDAKKEYWKLVINGKDSEVGAGSYSVNAGDTIAWEIATY